MPRAQIGSSETVRPVRLKSLTACMEQEVKRPSYSGSLGRIPVGSARGSSARDKRARSCEICEGDLWVEGKDGTHRPCGCHKDRLQRRGINQMRAGNWWRGTSLSFAAPPLSQIDSSI